MSDLIFSKNGIAFTPRSIDLMRGWWKFLAESEPDKKTTISWSMIVDTNGHPEIALGGQYEPDPNSIPDQVDDVVFYWYAEFSKLDFMKKYYVDADWGRKSRAVPLPKNESA